MSRTEGRAAHAGIPLVRLASNANSILFDAFDGNLIAPLDERSGEETGNELRARMRREYQWRQRSPMISSKSRQKTRRDVDERTVASEFPISCSHGLLIDVRNLRATLSAMATRTQRKKCTKRGERGGESGGEGREEEREEKRREETQNEKTSENRACLRRRLFLASISFLRLN